MKVNRKRTYNMNCVAGIHAGQRRDQCMAIRLTRSSRFCLGPDPFHQRNELRTHLTLQGLPQEIAEEMDVVTQRPVCIIRHGAHSITPDEVMH
jgi:hypothetical protein